MLFYLATLMKLKLFVGLFLISILLLAGCGKKTSEKGAETEGEIRASEQGCWIVIGPAGEEPRCILCTRAPENTIQIVASCTTGEECYNSLRQVGWPVFRTEERCNEWKANPTSDYIFQD